MPNSVSSPGSKAGKLSLQAWLAMFLSAGLCLLLLFVVISRKLAIEKMAMERAIIEKSIKINEIVPKLLYKTQALAALVIQSNGAVRDFDRVAATIVDDPAVLNILIAPGGVVSAVYPLQGNEKVVGYNLLGPGPGNREARAAKEHGRLIFGGPFPLVQGGQALVGRLPVWLGAPGEEKTFWGLVSVTLKYPQVLYGAGLDTLETLGFAYEIWRINPDTGDRQIIAASEYKYDGTAPYIEKHISILDADWYFRILPVKTWYEYAENWMFIILGLGVSVLVTCIVQNNSVLKKLQYNLEDMVRTDPLTGLLNRNGLFHELEELVRDGKPFILYYLDIDHFKKINELHGHQTGNRALTVFCETIRRHLGSGHIFGRVGGDEFVVCRPANGTEAVSDILWKDIETDLALPADNGRDAEIVLEFSRGSAAFPDDGGDADALVRCADMRMYRQRQERRAARQRAG